MPLPALVAAAPAIIGAAKGGLDIITGGSKYEKLKAEMDALATPFYKIQSEYTQNRDIAANRASRGMGAEQLDYLTNENQRGLGAGISALTQGGGGVNDLAKILDVYARTAERTAADDAALQTQNIAQFFAANKDLAGQKTIQWHENEYQPWANKQSLLAEQMNIAKKKKEEGFNSLLSGISGALTPFLNQDLNKAMTQTRPMGSMPAGGFMPNATETAYNVSGFTGMNPAPQAAPSRNATYEALMNGGMIPGTQSIPMQGAAQPFQYTDLNFDVNKNIWE